MIENRKLRPGTRLGSAAPQMERRPASRAEFLNELSGLRRSVAELGDVVAADYLAHALACFAKGKDEAG